MYSCNISIYEVLVKLPALPNFYVDEFEWHNVTLFQIRFQCISLYVVSIFANFSSDLLANVGYS